MRGDTCAALGALGALEHQLDALFVDDPNTRTLMGDIAAIRAVLIQPEDGGMPACYDPLADG